MVSWSLERLGAGLVGMTTQAATCSGASHLTTLPGMLRISSLPPTSIPIVTRWSAMDRHSFACGLRTDHSIACWGWDNEYLASMLPPFESPWHDSPLLVDLSVDHGALLPEFDRDVSAYELSVDNATTAITITPEVTNLFASYAISADTDATVIDDTVALERRRQRGDNHGDCRRRCNDRGLHRDRHPCELPTSGAASSWLAIARQSFSGISRGPLRASRRPRDGPGPPASGRRRRARLPRPAMRRPRCRGARAGTRRRGR